MITALSSICLLIISTFATARAEPIAATQAPSLEQMAGQMIMTGFQGTSPGDPAVQQIGRQLREGIIGGVILYAYNIQSREQVRRLTAFLSDQCPGASPFIAVDQEGGLVQRLTAANGFGNTPSASSMARLSLVNNYILYRRMAAMVHDAGFTVNFTPVVDLIVDPDSPAISRLGRSYSACPQRVSNHARVCVMAHRRHNVVT